MATEVRTFGDVRRMLIDTIMDLRGGSMSATQGMAIAANMKVLNDSVQVEINAAKLSLQTEKLACNFGKVVNLGQRTIEGEERVRAVPALPAPAKPSEGEDPAQTA